MARPVSFDRDQVVRRATDVFWDYGYADASIVRLVEATRLNPGSIYAAFHSKEGLFLESIDRYATDLLRQMRDIISRAPGPLNGVAQVLAWLAEKKCERSGRGCLLVNSLLEVGRLNERIRDHINQHFSEIEAEIRRALLAAQADGSLSNLRSAHTTAKFLMTVIWGISVLDGAGAAAEDVDGVVGEALRTIPH